MRLRTRKPFLPGSHLRRESSSASYRDVRAAVRVDERGIIAAEDALPCRVDGGKVVRRIVGEDDFRILLKMQLYAALEADWAFGRPFAIWHQNSSAAGFRHGVDCGVYVAAMFRDGYIRERAGREHDRGENHYCFFIHISIPTSIFAGFIRLPGITLSRIV